MDHVAIMKKSLGFLEKIVSEDKTIESRWYSTRRTPWNKINSGEIVFFQNSSSPVTIKTQVSKVLQFENLTPEKIKEILTKYGEQIDIEDTEQFFQTVKDKKYCILIFLEDVQPVKPFFINKKGFGMMSAWISVENISSIKR